MICLSWNCRGLGHPRAVRVLSELIKTHKPEVLFLFETLVHFNKLEEIRSKLGFEGIFAVDREGRSGGIGVLWKRAAVFSVLGYSRNHVDLKVDDGLGEPWRITGFYGIPERSRRRESWALLRQLSTAFDLPWVCIGDFNDMLNLEDKKGRVEHPYWLLKGFRDVVSECGLVDIPLLGYPYTWVRGKGTEYAVEERIDRALASMSWGSLFPDAQLLNLIAPISDHSPLLLSTVISHLAFRGRRRFKFENGWFQEPGLEDIVQNSWRDAGTEDVVGKLSKCAASLSLWGKNLAVQFRQGIGRCKEELGRLRNMDDAASLERYNIVKKELCHWLQLEEDYWRQRAKAFWLTEGDCNTRFFHATASTRRKVNQIHKLQDGMGNQSTDLEGICRIVKEHFDNLYSDNLGDYGAVINCVQQRVSHTTNESLLEAFTLEEFKTAIHQMHPDKSPGPDGFNPAFFQKFWHKIGP